jgi:hypothetical protein
VVKRGDDGKSTGSHINRKRSDGKVFIVHCVGLHGQRSVIDE